MADAWNQRFQRFSATGAVPRRLGPAWPGGAFDMNYPRSIAINPANRQIWVANERGHHIQVYNYPTSTHRAAPTYVGQIGQIGSDDIDPGHFRWPVDIEFYQPTDGNMSRDHRRPDGLQRQDLQRRHASGDHESGGPGSPIRRTP